MPWIDRHAAHKSVVIEESISLKAAFFRLQSRLNGAVPVGRGLVDAVSPRPTSISHADTFKREARRCAIEN